MVIGLTLNDSKSVMPTTVLTYLGVELDTVAMQARLNEEKLLESLAQLLSTEGGRNFMVSNCVC